MTEIDWWAKVDCSANNRSKRLKLNDSKNQNWTVFWTRFIYSSFFGSFTFHQRSLLVKCPFKMVNDRSYRLKRASMAVHGRPLHVWCKDRLLWLKSIFLYSTARFRIDHFHICAHIFITFDRTPEQTWNFQSIVITIHWVTKQKLKLGRTQKIRLSEQNWLVSSDQKRNFRNRYPKKRLVGHFRLQPIRAWVSDSQVQTCIRSLITKVTKVKKLVWLWHLKQTSNPDLSFRRKGSKL